MNETNTNAQDPFKLERFVSAQQEYYELALSEIRNGRKCSHWMWFIFPQLRGLGRSSTSQHYGISGADEARAYLAHDVLGHRLLTISQAALSVEGRSATEIFGTPDNKKLQSSATLFAAISSADSVSHQILQKYFNGRSDRRTMQFLEL